ncbi:MAG: hypothetical protein AAGA47_09940 [Pseudomonadota bacterium]
MKPLIPALAALALSACQLVEPEEPEPVPVSDDAEAIRAALAGRTLTEVGGSTVLRLTRRGAITGEGVEGRWEMRETQFCRTFTAPESLAGTECLNVVFLNNQLVTFFSITGNNTTWRVS